jgi:hypothetical protein
VGPGPSNGDMNVLLVLAFVVTTPPAETPDRDQRRREVAQVLKLGLSDLPADREALLETLGSPGVVWKRVAAIHALRPVHRQRALPVVRRLAKHLDVAIRIPAVIQWVRWELNAGSLRQLTNQRSLGGSLRGAFQNGEKRGRPLYRPQAATFFREGLTHSNLHARLDAAMGCVEMNQEPLRSRALKVLEGELTHDDPGVRLLALRYLSVQYDDPAFAPLLERARQDKDPAVRQAAARMTSRLAP